MNNNVINKFEYVPNDELHFPMLLVKLIEEIKKRFPLEINLTKESGFREVKIFHSKKFETLYCAVPLDKDTFFWEENKMAFFIIRGNFDNAQTFEEKFFDNHLLFICHNIDECRTILESIQYMY